jgi:hypothetical protein
MVLGGVLKEADLAEAARKLREAYVDQCGAHCDRREFHLQLHRGQLIRHPQPPQEPAHR